MHSTTFSSRHLVQLLSICLALVPSRAFADEPKVESYTWKNATIHGGGFVSGIVTHPRANGVIYARTDIGGAYRWDEQNRRWIPITDWIDAEHWNYTGIESLGLDPSDPDKVFLACGTYTNEWAKGNAAIFRTDDRGKTWKKAELPLKMGGNEDGRSNGERLAVDPNDGRVLFFGSRANGLWRSTDGGASWSRVNSFSDVKNTSSGSGAWSRPIGIVFVVFDSSSGSRGNRSTKLYAGVSTPDTSLFTSTDAGDSWQPLAGAPTGLRPHHAALAADGSLYVTYANHCGPNGLTDGAVWKLNTKSGEWMEISPVKPSADDKFGYAGVSVDQQHPQALIVGTLDRWANQDDIFRSTDGGKTWKSYLESAASRDISHAPYLADDVKSHRFGHWIGDCEINPFDSDHLLYVTGWGVWSSRDATALDRGGPTHWSFSSQGIEEVVANDVISPPLDGGAPALSVIWDLDGFRHDSLDASPSDGYFKPNFGRNTSIDFAQKQPSFCVRVYGGADNTHGSYSTDNGRTWTAFKTAPGDKLGDGFVAVSADATTIGWSPENGAAYVSRDRGDTWTACTGVPAKIRVASDREDDQSFYAFDGATGAIYVSTDGGATFARGPVTIAKSEGWLAAVPGKPGHFFVATDDGGLYRTTDAGQSFTHCPGVDKAHRVGFGKAAPAHDDPALYITGHVNGVYGFWRSDDAGKNWARINDDQHQFGTINAITGDMRVYGRVYLASANRGVLHGEPQK